MCVWASNHFRTFVWGKPFTSYDHKPLVKIVTTEDTVNTSSRVARLSVRLKDYSYKIVYVTGKENVIADFLSRMPKQMMECEDEVWNEF